MTKKQLKNKLMMNVNHKYDADIYVWELEHLTEDFVREMKDHIDFDELFERRSTVHPSPKFSNDFLNELKNEKNFGEWMTKESGLARYIRTSDVSSLKTDVLDDFKDDILKYASTLDAEDFNDYEDFYNNRYDDEMKEWLKKEEEKYYWKDGVQYYKDED